MDECARDAMTHCAGLSGLTAAVHIDFNIKSLIVFCQMKRLTNNHQRSFARKILIHRLIVNDDSSLTRFSKNTGDRAFAASCACMPVSNHSQALLSLYSSCVCGCCAVCGCAISG